jgi:hypothetical protein
MHRALFYLLAAAGLCGQTPTDLFHKAPPAVDEALRARIAKFYQLHVEGKFRLAEALVADETKDYFYSAGKPKYLGFEINRIDYADDFTTAKAVVITQRIVAMPGLTNKPMPWPEPSKWKLVNGDWYWYLTEDDLLTSPFGKSKPTPASDASQVPVIPGQEEMAKTLAEVRADKKEVTLKGDEESSAQFVISNPLSGAITLTVEGPPGSGFTVEVDHAEVPPGGKATVTVAWKPGSRPAPRLIQIVARVQPVNIVIPLRVKFVN